MLRDLLRQRLDEVVALHFAVVLSTVGSRDDDMHGRLVSPSPSLPRAFSLSLSLSGSIALSVSLSLPLSVSLSLRVRVSLSFCVCVYVCVCVVGMRVDMCSPRLRPLALQRSWAEQRRRSDGSDRHRRGREERRAVPPLPVTPQVRQEMATRSLAPGRVPRIRPHS